MIEPVARIESDGTGLGSRVLNANGEEIHGVNSASWKCDAGGVATLYLTISPAAIDAKAATWMFNSTEARGNRAGEWISVKDRLPDEGMYIMFDSDIGDESICAVRFTGKVWRHLKEWVSGTVMVTHWMPLPAPPKVD
jgi:hypothetical protein